jgi:hypothetical protein
MMMVPDLIGDLRRRIAELEREVAELKRHDEESRRSAAVPDEIGSRPSFVSGADDEAGVNPS